LNTFSFRCYPLFTFTRQYYTPWMPPTS